MGSILALLKQKGGSGSSTLAANLGAEWHARGQRVRVLDCDPQKSLSLWARLGEGGALQEIVEGVEANQGSDFREELERAREGSDWLVIDCAPGFDPLAIQAASVADCVVIPVRPSPLDFAAARSALEVAILGARGRAGARIAFAPQANLPRTRLGRELPEQLGTLAKESVEAPGGVRVLPGVSARIIVAEAAVTGQAVREIEPGGVSASEFAAVADALEGLRGEADA